MCLLWSLHTPAYKEPLQRGALNTVHFTNLDPIAAAKWMNASRKSHFSGGKLSLWTESGSRDLRQ